MSFTHPVALDDTVTRTVVGDERRIISKPSIHVMLLEVRNIVSLSEQLEYKKSLGNPSKASQYGIRLKHLDETKGALKFLAERYYQGS